jgi:hypothetical protein
MVLAVVRRASHDRQRRLLASIVSDAEFESQSCPPLFSRYRIGRRTTILSECWWIWGGLNELMYGYSSI